MIDRQAYKEIEKEISRFIRDHRQDNKQYNDNVSLDDLKKDVVKELDRIIEQQKSRIYAYADDTPQAPQTAGTEKATRTINGGEKTNIKKSFSKKELGLLSNVHPDLVKVFEATLGNVINYQIYETLRTLERQKDLLAKGKTQTLNSRHLADPVTGKCFAVDLVPIDWKDRADWSWETYRVIGKQIKECAEKVGVKITWGGDWTSFPDGPHFELDREFYK